MASNDQWPPVAAASSGKGNGRMTGNKRNIKESQQKVLSIVTEMFGSALEPGVILTVVQNCHWELQPSIEGLITLTETVENAVILGNMDNLDPKHENVSSIVSDDNQQTGKFKNILKDDSVHQSAEPQQEDWQGKQNIEPCEDTTLPANFEKQRKKSTKNRMGSFCGNIAKLKSSGENCTISYDSVERDNDSFTENIEHKPESSVLTNSDFFFNDIQQYGASGLDGLPETLKKFTGYGNLPDVPQKLLEIKKSECASKKKKQVGTTTQSDKNDSCVNPNEEQKVASLDSKTNMRKTESESLCGLKVQYRLSGMESSSDDDADVVIEDEASDYKINIPTSMPISVSQFLSPSTQTPPQQSLSEVNMINTPSPPQTPDRNVHDATLNRIKTVIQQGSKVMILLRGLPGSGKSTLAKSIIATTIGGNPSAYVFSADDFFVTLGRGEYHYDPTRLPEAHATNVKRVANAAKDGRSPIIVDNTNTEAWEMKPYAITAVENGYILEVLEPNTPWAQNVSLLAKKNIHNVPKFKIKDRFKKYERALTGKRLLERFSLKYSPQNTPPQRQRVPKFVDPVKHQNIDMAAIKSSWGNHEKNNYVLTSHDIESMQNIDESHNAMGISESKSVAENSSNSSTADNPEKAGQYGNTLFHDYLQELQDSDDESFDMLECSGSEHPSDIGQSFDSKETSDSHRGFGSSKHSPVEMLEEYATRNKDPSPIGPHQILGAIGSERKGSLSVASSIGNLDGEKSETDTEKNDNVLSQCWDFTLLLNGTKIHSTAPKNARISKESKSENTNSTAALTSDGSEELAEDKGNNIMWNSDGIEETVSSEKSSIKPKDDVVEMTIGNHETQEIYKNLKLEDVDKTESILIVAEDDKDDESLIDEIIENKEIDTEKVNSEAELGILSNPLHKQDNSETLIENPGESAVETAEKISDDVEQSAAKLTFGSIFNLIKTSILGGNDDPSTVAVCKEEGKCEQLEKNLIEDSSASGEPSEDHLDGNKGLLNENTVKLEACILQCKLDKIGEAKYSMEIDANADEQNTQPESVDSGEKVYPDLSTNPFREEMIKSRTKQDISDETKLPNEFCAEDSIIIDITPNDVTDNINSISWKESPFPIDGTKIPVIVTSTENNKGVIKIDATTNTTYYDFNVAYVGGTSEPGYRELSAFNRCINHGNTITRTTERPPLKLMLDKSSMTSEVNILAKEQDVRTEQGNDSVNGVPELIELFPHIPVEYLTEIYEQLCKCDFDWAVEVLLDGVPNDVSVKRSELNPVESVINDPSSKIVEPSKTSDEKNEYISVLTKQYPGLDIKDQKFKQRSQSSSPRYRRVRNKDFRTFSSEEQKWGSGELLGYEDEMISAKIDENAVIDLFYAKAISGASLQTEPDNILEGSLSMEASEALMEASGPEIADEKEDTIELNFGKDFINQLEQTFGDPNFAFPDEFTPVIRLKKSMAEQLHALWIQSMYDQLNARHAQLDEMIAKDAEFARALGREETAKSTKEPVAPNLDEIMDMEMALACYKNELKAKIARETPNDMASRLTRQMLYDSLPDIDQDTLSEILKAHNGNFKETCEIIESSTGRTISKTDTLKKQQNLLDRVKEESKNRGIQQNSEGTVAPMIVVSPFISGNAKLERMAYKAAMERGEDARIEAQKQFTHRIENFNKAAEAYRKGYPEVAAYYSQMAKLHSENIHTANAEAIDAFISAKMYNPKDGDTLDLHNLFVPEALKALDIFLDYQLGLLSKSNNRSMCLYIITGRGARSNNGLSKIKPAVSKELTRRNIRFTEANPGCLKVLLSKKTATLD